MRKYLAIIGILVVLISLGVYIYNEISDSPAEELRVYSYSSFVSSWGPGPELKREFKKFSGYGVNFVDAGEVGVIMQRLNLERDKPKADIVVGLNQFHVKMPDVRTFFEPLPVFEFKKHKKVSSDKIRDSHFISYNWSPMSFIYRKGELESPPRKLDDFMNPERTRKIILLDPRTSAPGLIFFSWLLQLKGEKDAKVFLSSIKQKVYTVAPSWSAGYGMFKKKQSSFIFSYLTSPIYHWVEERDTSYQALKLEEPMPYHIEYAGIVSTSAKKALAQKFMEFLLTPTAQKIIMTKNYMLPVVAGVDEDTPFEAVESVDLFELNTDNSIQDTLRVWKSIEW